MKYNYLENIKEDIKEYIKENYDDGNIPKYDILESELWTEDSITGNGSGSYTFNSHRAHEYLQGNEDLLNDTIREFGVDIDKHWDDYEYLDVSIRCYLLSQALLEVLREV